MEKFAESNCSLAAAGGRRGKERETEGYGPQIRLMTCNEAESKFNSD